MVKVLSEYSNATVIKDYLNTISAAFSEKGEEIIYAKDITEISVNDWVIVPIFTDAIKLYLKGCRNIVLWQQGLNAEESFMRNHSTLRRYIIEKLEKFILKRAKMVFFVSEEMKCYYEKKYKFNFVKYQIMPCFNEEFNSDVFNTKDYSKKIFTYIGSMAVWQCFDKIAEIYKYIEDKISDAELLVLTFNTQEATEILKKHGVKNYTVDCVDKEQVNARLSNVTYGFVIREDDPVNRVSTPTKFSSYLAAGVIPIFSDIIVDFTTQTKNLKYVHSVPQNGGMDDVVDFVKQPIEKEELFEEYKNFFAKYYSKEKYIKEISKKIEELL